LSLPSLLFWGWKKDFFPGLKGGGGESYPRGQSLKRGEPKAPPPPQINASLACTEATLPKTLVVSLTSE